jgi:hypothetical protein
MLLILASCAHIDRHVVGWPQDLKITEMRTSFWDVQAKCWDDLPIVQKILLPVVIACTVVNLDARTCVIYSFDDMTDDTRAHEYDHCKGGAHDDGWQEYFDKWKAKAGV